MKKTDKDKKYTDNNMVDKKDNICIFPNKNMVGDITDNSFNELEIFTKSLDLLTDTLVSYIYAMNEINANIDILFSSIDNQNNNGLENNSTSILTDRYQKVIDFVSELKKNCAFIFLKNYNLDNKTGW